MTPEEEAYEEALRRIREAEETGAVALDLSKLELNRLPRELADITSLQTLYLSGLRLSDLTPLARLTSLQTLDLSFCDPLNDLSPLAELISLQELDFTECGAQLSDLTPLAGLTSLKGLNLSGCHMLRDLPPLAKLTSLSKLNLFGCYNLSDLSPLEGLTSLQTLNLCRCYNLSDLSPLAGLTSLQTLDLSGCEQLSGDLSPLAGLTSLQTLNLCRYYNLSDLSPLAGLTSLQTLDLSGCEQLSGDLSPLAGLTSLQTLDLSGCGQLSGRLAPLAGLNSLQSLKLSECEQLSDLSPLSGLRSLQTLDLSGCRQLSGDLSPLAGLSSLETLDLSGCEQLSDLSQLVGLSSLETLNLSGCTGVGRFAPLEALVSILQSISLFGCRFDDLPQEVCGEQWDENVLSKVCAHFADLASGECPDTEVKVLFLGNGGVGKTQLCRRLCNLPFDPNIATTHGIEFGQTPVKLDDFPESVRLNLWDFGGQDIYHGSHALFLQGQAIFLILWTPELEQQTTYHEGELSFGHRPLSYWLDYVRAFAGTDASVLIVQSQCDTRDKRILRPPAPVDDFPFHRYTEVSARTGLNLGILEEYIKEAVRDRFDRFPPPPIGIGRLKVRDKLREMLEEDQKREPAKRQHRLLERTEFDRICEEAGGVSDVKALLDFLHHNGVLFYRPGLFGDRIVLDQNWALKAIYAIFDRKKILPLLRGNGRFSRADLEALIWSRYTPEEQKVFLGMMESCGICFKVRELSKNEWEYIAPELLPPWSDAQELLLGRLRDDFPDAEARAGYAFLHEGILRGYLSKLGEHAKDAAIYWKYGCWFYERTTRSQVVIESIWDDAESESGAGAILLRAWGERANDLIEQLLQALQKLPVGQAPKIEQNKRIPTHAESLSSASVTMRLISQGGDAVSSHHGTAEPGDKTNKGALEQLEIQSRPELPPEGTPAIFVSFAWGDDSSQEARQRTEIVDRLCEMLGQHGWHILRDSNVLRPGDLISGFMKRIGLADHVIVVLSDKYLRSPYCMTELHYIYQRSLGEKEDFLSRIIPMVLADARFGTWRDRLVYTKHWRAEFEEMELHFKDLGEADFRLYKAMQEWHNRIGDMLAYVNDKLVPHGFDEIVKDDFAGLRQMLQRRQPSEDMSRSAEATSPDRIGGLHEKSFEIVENQSLSHDVCIICAMREEGEAAIKAFSQRFGVEFKSRFTRSNRQYNHATITNDAKEHLTIHLSWPAGNGPEEISLHTSAILNEFRPRFAGMTGICAGDPKKVKLGDLVVANKAFKYDSGKMVFGADGQPEHLPDTDTKGPDQSTLQFVANFREWAEEAERLERPISKLQQRDWLLNALLDDRTPRIDALDERELDRFAPAWRDLISELQAGETPELTSDLALRDENRVRKLKLSRVFPFRDPTKPKVHVASMASGSMVRSDRPFERVQRPVRTAWAVEMEGYAFYRAVADHPRTRSLVVKGVCDYADPEKDDSYHAYASEVSAIYMAEFIRVYVNTDLMPA